jgi:4'-phosphopantetheinyl transferase EntD
VNPITTRPTEATNIASPRELQHFAAFSVSQPCEPIPDLEPAEQTLLSASTVHARRESFARGRAAAHAALRTLGLDDGPILAGPNREPIWPAGATGSISHAAGFGVALVAPTAYTDGVGVDLEQLRHAPELWDQVPRTEERRWLEQIDSGEQNAMIHALFSAKESVYKAFFPRIGSFFGFEMASMAPVSSGFIGRMSDGLDDEYPSKRSFTITSQWFGDIVLTSLVLPKTKSPEEAQQQ